jgi:ABC-type polar amino acid transport system ATPase subunit
MMRQDRLSMENGTKCFGAIKALDDMTLTISPNTVTAVIGPSGSGKTTLIRALSLLDCLDKGTVTIDGRIYLSPSGTNDARPDPWPSVTVVFQQLFLWPHLTVRKNVELAAKPGRNGLKELYETLNMTGFLDRYPNEVSAGQRQLGAIARAFAVQPKYLLLDEITAALDVEHVSAVLSTLVQAKQKGIGVLVVTHHLGFARKAADTILFLDHGRIVEAGSPAMLDSPDTDRLRVFLRCITWT